MTLSNVGIALALTLFAGLATGIGSAIAFFAKRTNYRFLSVSTGFSAGVMLYVSFVEILPKGTEALSQAYGVPPGHWASVGAFFAGIALIGLIDNFIPAAENPHEIHAEDELAPLHNRKAPLPDFSDIPAQPSRVHHEAEGFHDHSRPRRKLMRMGLFMALAITIHNFPEGLATFLAALHDPQLGVAIALALALHNIPEGISVSVPIFYATGKRSTAFFYSFMSGMAEPVGAVVAWFGLQMLAGGDSDALPIQWMGGLFSAVAGIMVYISLDELLPTSQAYGKGHDSLFGLLAGMGVMSLSLLLMM